LRDNRLGVEGFSGVKPLLFLFGGQQCKDMKGIGLTPTKCFRSFLLRQFGVRMAVDIEAFRKEVYNVVASIPSGRVLSYGKIAWLVGCPRHARLVGKVLHGVSETENLTCHRVVNGNGRTAPCWEEQRGLLEAEGITFRANGCVDMRKWQWKLEE